jgi:hypothetical protein
MKDYSKYFVKPSLKEEAQRSRGSKKKTRSRTKTVR